MDARVQAEGPMLHPMDSTDLNDRWFANKSNMVNDIFDELVSINVYNDYDKKIDTLLIDSILRVELMEKGVSADYVFGITATKEVHHQMLLYCLKKNEKFINHLIK